MATLYYLTDPFVWPVTPCGDALSHSFPANSSHTRLPRTMASIHPETVANTDLLLEDLRRLFETRAHADVRLLAKSHIEGGPRVEFEAHASILIARSEYFRALFKGGFVEQRECKLKTIELEQCVPRAFERVLEYAYTGSTTVSEDALGVMICGSQFCFWELERLCCEYVIARINAVNVWDVWWASYKVFQDDVVEACRAFAVQHASEVFGSPSIVEASEDQLLAVLGDEELGCEEIEVCVGVGVIV